MDFRPVNDGHGRRRILPVPRIPRMTGKVGYLK
jgi:hypothetical protein